MSRTGDHGSSAVRMLVYMLLHTLSRSGSCIFRLPLTLILTRALALMLPVAPILTCAFTAASTRNLNLTFTLTLSIILTEYGARKLSSPDMSCCEAKETLGSHLSLVFPCTSTFASLPLWTRDCVHRHRDLEIELLDRTHTHVLMLYFKAVMSCHWRLLWPGGARQRTHRTARRAAAGLSESQAERQRRRAAPRTKNTAAPPGSSRKVPDEEPDFAHVGHAKDATTRRPPGLCLLPSDYGQHRISTRQPSLRTRFATLSWMQKDSVLVSDCVIHALTN